MPLPIDDMVREADATGRVRVVDETRHGGGVGGAIVTRSSRTGSAAGSSGWPAATVACRPGDAAKTVLLGKDDIERAVRRLLS